MSERVYGSIRDTYCYEGSKVLKNKIGIRDQNALNDAERQLTSLRFEEPLPRGRFDVKHYCAIHHHLFQDIFAWAGEFRTIRIAKGSSMFCYPEFIANEMQVLFARMQSDILGTNLQRQEFAERAANFLAELNAIHPFREGNGRSQLTLLTLLAEQTGHPLKLKTFDPDGFLEAMIASFNGDISSLVLEILGRR